MEDKQEEEEEDKEEEGEKDGKEEDKEEEEGKRKEVSWCFEPGQAQRITSGLTTNFTLSPGGKKRRRRK